MCQEEEKYDIFVCALRIFQRGGRGVVPSQSYKYADILQEVTSWLAGTIDNF